MTTETDQKTQHAEEKFSVFAAKMGGRCSVCFFAFYLYLVLWCRLFASFQPPTDKATMFNRIAYAIRWQILVAFTLMLQITYVGYKRSTSGAVNPLNAKRQGPMKLPRKILQNTLEQSFVHFLAVGAFSTVIEPVNLHVIPAFTVLFVIGRIVFYIGYHIGPEHRSAGFMINFLGNYAMMGYALYRVVTVGWLHDFK